jgi:hypothetical protein
MLLRPRSRRSSQYSTMDTNLVMNRQIAYVKSLLMDMKAQLPEGVDDDTFVVKKKTKRGSENQSKWRPRENGTTSDGNERSMWSACGDFAQCGRLVGTSPRNLGRNGAIVHRHGAARVDIRACLERAHPRTVVAILRVGASSVLGCARADRWPWGRGRPMGCR